MHQLFLEFQKALEAVGSAIGVTIKSVLALNSVGGLLLQVTVLLNVQQVCFTLISVGNPQQPLAVNLSFSNRHLNSCGAAVHY
ncbi:hypothetical protein FGO68_gene580 [Halteria grandinella]|uniref:Uncharacterized protein n=1 Tax=Halteria grandinella TaxID=5974 RepID=A0A8J8NAU5_HALGN|nr:hypothetical protein FGO68_gene580 [Halteria grandinella]